MIGQHLLPVNTVVKAAVFVFARRPNPIQEVSRDAFSRITSRCHTRPEELRFNLHKIFL